MYINTDSFFNDLAERAHQIEVNEKIREAGMKLVHLDAFDVEIDSEQYRKDKLAELRSKIFVDLCLTPKKIILHDPATIILWDDDTKTVVKCNPEYDTFDPEKGIALCFMKKALGNRGKFNDILKKGIEDNEQENLPSTALFGKSLSKFVDLITAKEEEKLDDEY